jgi:hypothetical protein
VADTYECCNGASSFHKILGISGSGLMASQDSTSRDHEYLTEVSNILLRNSIS